MCTREDVSGLREWFGRAAAMILLGLVAIAVSVFIMWAIVSSRAEGQELRSVTYYEQVWQGDTFWVAQHDMRDTTIPTGRETLAALVGEGPLPYLTIYPDIRITSTPCVN